MQPSKWVPVAGRIGMVLVLLLSVVAMGSAVRRTASSVRILARGWTEPARADDFKDRYSRRPLLSLVHSVAGILFIEIGRAHV